jgi:hypothetical protein
MKMIDINYDVGESFEAYRSGGGCGGDIPGALEGAAALHEAIAGSNIGIQGITEFKCECFRETRMVKSA